MEHLILKKYISWAVWKQHLSVPAVLLAVLNQNSSVTTCKSHVLKPVSLLWGSGSVYITAGMEKEPTVKTLLYTINPLPKHPPSPNPRNFQLCGRGKHWNRHTILQREIKKWVMCNTMTASSTKQRVKDKSHSPRYPAAWGGFFAQGKFLVTQITC